MRTDICKCRDGIMVFLRSNSAATDVKAKLMYFYNSQEEQYASEGVTFLIAAQQATLTGLLSSTQLWQVLKPCPFSHLDTLSVSM